MSYTKKELLEALSHVEDDNAIIDINVLKTCKDGSEEGFIYPISGVCTGDNFKSLSIYCYEDK